MRLVFFFLAVVLGILVFVSDAIASNAGDACAVGQNGYVQFDSGALLICDGVAWNSAVQATNAAGRILLQVDSDGGACSTSKLGRLQYNSSGSPAWKYCDGTAWQPFQRSGVGGNGYFVQTTTKWSGNLGGLSGANAKCLTELQATYNWLGKSSAGTLTSGRVYAFLCDGTSCNNLKPNTPYLMAKANSTTLCGTGFITDASGQGPNTRSYWDENCFDAGSNTWMNRGTVSASVWTTTKAGSNHCVNWTSNSSGQSGAEGAVGNNNALRWNEGTDTCNLTNFLVCIVDP